MNIFQKVKGITAIILFVFTLNCAVPGTAQADSFAFDAGDSQAAAPGVDPSEEPQDVTPSNPLGSDLAGSLNPDEGVLSFGDETEAMLENNEPAQVLPAFVSDTPVEPEIMTALGESIMQNPVFDDPVFKQELMGTFGDETYQPQQPGEVMGFGDETFQASQIGGRVDMLAENSKPIEVKLPEYDKDKVADTIKKGLEKAWEDLDKKIKEIEARIEEARKEGAEEEIKYYEERLRRAKESLEAMKKILEDLEISKKTLPEILDEMKKKLEEAKKNGDPAKIAELQKKIIEFLRHFVRVSVPYSANKFDACTALGCCGNCVARHVILGILAELIGLKVSFVGIDTGTVKFGPGGIEQERHAIIVITLPDGTKIYVDVERGYSEDLTNLDKAWKIILEGGWDVVRFWMWEWLRPPVGK